MIRIKYRPNPQGIKEVEIQPQLVDSLAKKNKENKKRTEPKKNNLKQKEETPKVVPTPPKKEKSVETKKSTTKNQQNGVETKEGATIRVYSPEHGCTILKQEMKGEKSYSLDSK